MIRSGFDKILFEEGIEDIQLRDDLWHSRPAGELSESRLRAAAKKFKEKLPSLRVAQALNRALDKEFGREE